MDRTPWPIALLLAMGTVMAACEDNPTGVDPRDAKSGLYYLDLQVGTGDAATAGKTVSVLYRGWLPDATLFDQRQNPTDPLRFMLGVGMVIAGWDKGLPGMRVGGVRKLVIPSSLGYGNQAVDPIPANSVLVFEVTLLAVE